MAAATNTPSIVGEAKKFSVTTTGTVDVGEAFPHGASTWLIHAAKGTSFSWYPQGYPSGAGLSVTNAQSLAYRLATDDPATFVANATAITTDGAIWVNADGMVLVLNVTAISGTATFYCIPIRI